MGKKKKHPIRTGILIVFVLLLLIGGLGSRGSKSEPAKVAEEPAVTPVEEVAEEPQEQTAPAEEPAEAPVAETPAEEPAEAPAETETPADGMSPELKDFLDSYEAFMDEYCAFMESYDSSDAAALLKYSSLMAKYAEFAKKADEWNSRAMNDAETLYYVQVMNRVNEKLLKVSAGM